MCELVVKREKSNKKEKVLVREYIDEGVFYRVKVNALLTYEDCNITL